MSKRPKHEANGIVPSCIKPAEQRVPCDLAAVEKLPNLYACLMPVWRDGKQVRRAGSLRIKPLGCNWHLTLSCPSEGVECSVEVNTLFGAFDVLEAILANLEANWRPDWETQKKVAKHA